jgi:mercuric ion transport protein
VLEPYRPIFIAAAVVALAMAWRRIWRPASACAPDEACAIARVKVAYKVLFAVVVLLVVIALAFPYIAALFY